MVHCCKESMHTTRSTDRKITVKVKIKNRKIDYKRVGILNGDIARFSLIAIAF